MSSDPTLADVGEFAVIDRLVAGRPPGSKTLLGPGDDAAVVAAPDARVVEAFMLIQTEVGRAEVVAKQVATLPGVLTAEYVTGPYDVIVRIGADTLERMQTDVVSGVQQISGITRTLTCPIASKTQP